MHKRWLGILISVGFAPVGSAATHPPIYFNHATIVVAPEVFKAIAEAPFLRNDFSAFDSETTQADDGKTSYSAVYLDGMHTYFEIMQAGGINGPAGGFGFGMWLEDRKLLAAVRDALPQRGGKKPEIKKRTLHVEGGDIDWFDATSAPGDDTMTWVMAPYAEFLRARHPGIEARGVGTSREQALSWRFVPGRWLKDIARIEVTVTAAERKLLSEELEAYGYNLRTDGPRTVATGPEIEVAFVVQPPAAPRMLRLGCSLTRAPTQPLDYKFGSGASLHLDADGRAEWVFTSTRPSGP
jgi:hypothetical protein